MRPLRIAAVLLPLLSLAVLAQGPPPASVALPPAPLLPQTFGVFHRTGTTPAAVVIAPDEAKEYGVKRSETAEYNQTDGGKTTLTIAATEMQDATGAYSYFTLHHAGMHRCDPSATLGEDCALATGHLAFWAGDTAVDVTAIGLQGIKLSALRDLLTTLPKPSGTKGALPLLPTRLPKPGLEVESIRYAVGPATYAKLGFSLPADVVEFNKSPEIITAHYAGRPGSGTLAVIFYPTPQIASDRSRAIEAVFKSDPNTAVRRVSTMVAIATHGFTQAQATALVGKVTENMQVTWNKPEGFVDKVQQTASVMVKILAFVGIMTFAAAILGVFFGGARALIRKMQGKPLSSLEDMEIIRLDLGGKPSTKLQHSKPPIEPQRP